MARQIFTVSTKVLREIHESYSADVLPKLRPPAKHGGESWTCTCAEGTTKSWVCRAYRLVSPVLFEGPTYDNKERCRYDHDDEHPCAFCIRRESVEGYYHGIRVKHKGQDYVLCGPPVEFTDVASEAVAVELPPVLEAAQLSLF